MPLPFRFRLRLLDRPPYLGRLATCPPPASRRSPRTSSARGGEGLEGVAEADPILRRALSEEAGVQQRLVEEQVVEEDDRHPQDQRPDQPEFPPNRD